MRELTLDETEATQGGFLPLVVATAMILAGCSTTGSLRRGEDPPE